MAKRSRKKKQVEPVEDPTMRQLALDFTPEVARDMLFEAGELAGRIDSLKVVAKTSLSEARDLKKKLDFILAQAGAKKRSVEVEVYEKADFTAFIVRTLRKDNDEEVSFRHMTPEERESGVVPTAGQAAQALANVAAAAGEGDYAFNEDDPPPQVDPVPPEFTDVERAGMGA